MCSLIAHVEGDKVVRLQGDPDQPYTAGFACGKVNRDTDNVNSPERLRTPLRRSVEATKPKKHKATAKRKRA